MAETRLSEVYVEPEFILQKQLSYKRRIRVRVKKFADGHIEAAIYGHDAQQQQLWSVPIPAIEAERLDWTVNVFGYRNVGNGGWGYVSSDRDYSEAAELLDWLTQYRLPE